MEMKYPFQWIRAPTAIYWNLKEPFILRISKSLASLNSMRRLELKSVGSLYNVYEIHSKEVNASLFEVKAMDKDTEADSDRKVKEEERRRKIGLANKGKVPWNKGRKHTEGREKKRDFYSFRYRNCFLFEALGSEFVDPLKQTLADESSREQSKL